MAVKRLLLLLLGNTDRLQMIREEMIMFRTSSGTHCGYFIIFANSPVLLMRKVTVKLQCSVEKLWLTYLLLIVNDTVSMSMRRGGGMRSNECCSSIIFSIYCWPWHLHLKLFKSLLSTCFHIKFYLHLHLATDRHQWPLFQDNLPEKHAQKLTKCLQTLQNYLQFMHEVAVSVAEHRAAVVQQVFYVNWTRRYLQRWNPAWTKWSSILHQCRHNTQWQTDRQTPI